MQILPGLVLVRDLTESFSLSVCSTNSNVRVFILSQPVQIDQAKPLSGT